jgi:tRNA pseudouridine38-40 synthase
MPRFFIELSYKGTRYSGFQKQQNANSIQAELEKALNTYFKHPFELTGSSRTDAGVHALQNYFHFDTDIGAGLIIAAVYHLNAILPADISVTSIKQVAGDAHCRFDASYRRYEYRIYRRKNPFLQDIAYFFPYKLNVEMLHQCAEELKLHQDFEAFSKKNSQVFTHNCIIMQSQWAEEADYLVYYVQANRFLRGMVKGIVGTMLKTATKGHSLDQFRDIILSKDCTKADFTPPSHGLLLAQVGFPNIF